MAEEKKKIIAGNKGLTKYITAYYKQLYNYCLVCATDENEKVTNLVGTF